MLPLLAQEDYDWWNKKHNWDGHSPWRSYLTYSPAYFGPNALPVPEIRHAMINDYASLESRVDLHFSDGDKTQDLFLKLNYPFVDGRVAFEISWVPVEHFELDTITRDERAVRFQDAKGYVVGDIAFSTLIQILSGHRSWPDLLLGVSFRAPSGGGLGYARYTDAPGYHFDFSAGKNFSTGERVTLRPFAMFGFYVWQTNIDQSPQNDAFLYGLGLLLQNSSFECQANWGGYMGYMDNGDSPMVARFNARYKLPIVHLKLSLQQGIQDFEYTSIGLGVVFICDPIR
jgi:hypothetical protein